MSGRLSSAPAPAIASRAPGSPRARTGANKRRMTQLSDNMSSRFERFGSGFLACIPAMQLDIVYISAIMLWVRLLIS